MEEIEMQEKPLKDKQKSRELDEKEFLDLAKVEKYLGCSINDKGRYNPRLIYSSNLQLYKCGCYNNPDFKICSFCKTQCHSGHDCESVQEENPQNKYFECYCGSKGHIVDNDTIKKKFTTDLSINLNEICDVSKYFYQSDYNYLHKYEDKLYCMYCIVYCACKESSKRPYFQEKFDKRYEKIPIEDQFCSCKNLKNHPQFSIDPRKNFVFSNFEKVFSNSFFLMRINAQKLIQGFLDKNSFFFRQYVDTLSKFSQFQNLEFIRSEIYERSNFQNNLQIIRIITRFYKKSSLYRELFDDEFYRFFSFQNLNLMFDEKIKIQKDDQLAISKRLFLSIFRYGVLIPKIFKDFYFFSYGEEYLTPFHRRLNSKHKKIFSEDFDFQISDFHQIYHNLGKNIRKHIEINSKEYCLNTLSLLIEYVKFIKPILNYQLELLDIGSIVKSLSQCFYSFNTQNYFSTPPTEIDSSEDHQMYSIYSKQYQKLQRNIKKIYERLIIKINDIAYLENNDNFIFSDSELNRKILDIYFTTIHADKNVNYNFKDLLFNKNDIFIETLSNLFNSKIQVHDLKSIIGNDYLVPTLQVDPYTVIISEEILTFDNLIKKLILDQISEGQFLTEINSILDKKNSVLEFRDQDSNAGDRLDLPLLQGANSGLSLPQDTKFEKKIKMIRKGYLNKIIQLLILVDQFQVLEENEKITELYIRKLFDLISNLMISDTFIVNYFMSSRLISILFSQKNFFFKCSHSYEFYTKLFKMCKLKEYKINVFPIVEKIVSNQFMVKDFNTENKLNQYNFSLRLLKNSLNHINREQNPLFSELITPILISLLTSTCTPIIFDRLNDENFLFSIQKKREINDEIISSQSKFIQMIFTLILSLNDDCFIKISSFFENLNFLSKENILKILLNKELIPSLRCLIFEFYTKLYLSHHYRIKELKEPIDFIELNEKNQGKTKIKNLKLSEMAKSIFEEVKIFPLIVSKYKSVFTSKVEFLYKYFEKSILKPLLYINQLLMMMSEDFDDDEANFKYLTYTSILLLMKSLDFFLKTIITFENFEKYYSDIFISNTEDLKDKINQDLQEINIGISEMQDQKFSLSKTNNSMKNLHLISKIYRYSNYNRSLLQDSSKIEKVELDNKEKNLILNSLDNYIRLKNDDSSNFISTFLSEGSNTKYLKKLFIFTLNTLIMTENYQKDKSGNPNHKISTGEFAYSEKNSKNFEELTFLYYINPKFIQDSLAELRKGKINNLLKLLIKKTLPCLIQLIFIQNELLASDPEVQSYKNFCTILDFIRLFAENHNQYFQCLIYDIKYFSEPKVDLNKENENNNNVEKKENTESKSKREDNLITFVIKSILYVENVIGFESHNSKYLCYLDKNSKGFFEGLIDISTKFLIEMFQGSFSFLYDDLNKNNIESFNKLFSMISHIESNPKYDFLGANFLSFFYCLMSDSNNSDQNKRDLLNIISLKTLSKIMLYSTKKLYEEKLLHPDIHPLKLSERIDSFNFILENNSSLKLNELFRDDEDVLNNYMFRISTNIFLLLNLVFSMKIGDKSNQAGEILNSLVEEDTQKTMSKQNTRKKIQTIEIYLFLSNIVRSVEILSQNVEQLDLQLNESYRKNIELSPEMISKIDEEKTQETSLKRVWFIIHPHSLFLNKDDINAFIENSKLTDINEQLSELIHKVNYFSSIIDFRVQINNSKSVLLSNLSNINYLYVEWYSAFMVLFINIFIAFSATMNTSDNSIINSLYSVYTIISLIHLIILFSFFSNWLIFELWKLYRYNKRFTTTSLKTKILETIEIFMRMKILPIFWNLILGIIAISYQPINFLYSIQLLSLWSLVPTMRIALFAVQARYQQFLASILFIIVIIFFFSFLSFYWLSPEFRFNDVGDVCYSLWSCFLFIMNYGFRSGGGIGDVLKTHLIEENDLFWGRFFYDWGFYFLINLLMINIINAIIVDTFQDLRQQRNDKEERKFNYCYICDKNRAEFEALGLDFENHRNKNHSLDNYIYFLVKIRLINELDLNSLETQVLDSINKERPDFFPVERALEINK